MPSMRPFRTRHLMLGALIAVMTVVCYLPAIRAGAVWDDDKLVLDNDVVRSANGLYRIWVAGEFPDYYPVTWSAFWLQWRIWGDWPGGYHAVNVLLHAGSAALLWLVLRRLALPGAWLAAMVWAVHPVNVASVAWISELKNTLSMLLCLTAALLYLRAEDKWRWQTYAASVAAFALALLSKASVVTVPVLLLACAWWRRGRITKNNLLRAAPLFAMAGIMGVVAVWFQTNKAIGAESVPTEAAATRLAIAGKAVWFYVYKALVPLRLTMIYPRWEVDGGSPVAHLPWLAAVAAAVVFWAFRKSWGRGFLLAAGCFLAAILPVLGVFPMYYHIFSYVADHWQYIAIAPVIALAVCGAAKLSEAGPAWVKRLASVAAVVVVALLGVLTWRQTLIYESEETLWHDTLEKNPDAWIAHYNLGTSALFRGERVKGVEHLRESVRIWPDYYKAQSNLAVALTDLGRPDQALEHHDEAIRLQPRVPVSHYNKASALVRLGRLDEALGCYRVAIAITPNYAEAHNAAGTVLYNQGHFDDAAAYFLEAVRLAPDNAEHHLNLGNSRAKLKMFPEAESSYQRALAIRPDYPFAHNNLGQVLATAGKFGEAIAHYERALQLNPDYQEARRNLQAATEAKRAAPN